MKTTDSGEPPIACTLDAGTFQERLAWITALNRAALLGARREGARLMLTYRRGYAERVREMVRRERQCCGFLEFSVTDDRDGVRLVIEAPKRATGALDAIFDPFLAGPFRNGEKK